MRKILVLAGLYAIVTACVPREPEELIEAEVDVEAMLAATEQFEKYREDNLAFGSELVTDEAGCIGPRWVDTSIFVYDPRNPDMGMGVHVEDLTYPVDTLDPERPRTMLWNYEGDNAEMVLRGLEWYFEPPGGEPLEEQPMLFGYPMPGVMEGHVQFQGFHYDVHVWPWLKDERLNYDYFGEFHPEMPTPQWFLDFEPTLYASWQYNYFEPRYEEGYVEGPECIDGEGVHWVNEDLIGELDPLKPDTILTDVSGLMIGVQWTVHESEVQERPSLFGIPFYDPDEDGNYELRMWMGVRTTGSYWVEKHPTMSCAEFKIPDECMPDIPDINAK